MRSVLSSAAAMWFPSSNNVSVIYEWPATIPAQPPRYSTISSPYHNKLRPNSRTQRGLYAGAVCVYSMCMCVSACIGMSFLCTCVCVCKQDMLVNLPFGGGLTSVSPCWFELSDCPDCSERKKKKREKERDG